MRSSPTRSLALLAIATSLTNCGGATATETRTMSKVAGDNQTVAVGVALATKPTVKIVNQDNAGVAGVTVTFAVASGGGSATGTSVTTGGDGVATVGSWTLGTTAGANTMTATASGVTGSPVTFGATATAPPAPTATAMTKQAGDAQTGAVSRTLSVAPTVKLVDASGAPVAGVSVTFNILSGGGFLNAGGNTANVTTNANGIAAITGWTLGSTPGASSLQAFTAGTGITGNPAMFTATAVGPFAPLASTTLSGTQVVASVSIPAGVVVTLTGDVSLTVVGTVDIAGTITGNCFNLAINSTGPLTSSGTINNGCTGVPLPLPTLTLIAAGGYHFTGGTITSSGDLTISNDPSLTDASFPAPPAGLRSAFAAALHQAAPCSIGNTLFAAAPAAAIAGQGGPVGGPAADGSSWVLQCNGELDLTGGVQLRGQDGGSGGNGITNSNGNGFIAATGGAGGRGGAVKVRVVGDIVMTGTGNVVQGGSGGPGGSATATTLSGFGAAGAGISALSTGGAGGAAGGVTMQAKNGSLVLAGFSLTMGGGGAGGNATATGSGGRTALPCPNGIGGFATAIGGLGGSVLDKQVTATATITGLAGASVTGGAPGRGGNAKATAGDGGAGASTCKPGAVGGALDARGGKGGDTQFRDGLGVLVANGGAGGSMEVAGGRGGAGWSDCVAGSLTEAGGAGGAAGAVGGADGLGGTGKIAGASGGGTLNGAGNGGAGGNGTGPGLGGATGTNSIAIAGTTNTLASSFLPGTPGNACPGSLLEPASNFDLARSALRRVRLASQLR